MSLSTSTRPHAVRWDHVIGSGQWAMGESDTDHSGQLSPLQLSLLQLSLLCDSRWVLFQEEQPQDDSVSVSLDP